MLYLYTISNQLKIIVMENLTVVISENEETAIITKTYNDGTTSEYLVDITCDDVLEELEYATSNDLQNFLKTSLDYTVIK